MALEGLRRVEHMQPVNWSDEVGASVEALHRLGLVHDREKVADSIKADFKLLNNTTEIGKYGEPFIQVPRDVAKLPLLITMLDYGNFPADKQPRPLTYVEYDLWTPDAETEGYSPDDIGNLELGRRYGSWLPHARLAVHNTANPSEPLLHFLGMPFDDDKRYAEKDQETQLTAIASEKKEYESSHEGFVVTPLNVNAVVMIALKRRIMGKQTAEKAIKMPFEQGAMRDATLGRRTSDRSRSVVGMISWENGGLELRGSPGRASSDVGVGLTVGPRALEHQVN